MRTLAALVALVSLAACGGSDGTSGPGAQKTPDGAYTLSTINAKALPATVVTDTGGFKQEVLSGTLNLTTDGKYSVVTAFRETLPGVTYTYNDSTGGTWTQSGGTISFTDASDGSKDQATWTSGKLSISDTVGTTVITIIYLLKR